MKVKYLLQNHADLGSEPQTPHKPGMVAYVYNSRLGRNRDR